MSNCRPILKYAGNPSIATIFILSILLNSIVILVILDMGKRKKTSTRLFLALAVSDITMAASFVLAAVMNWWGDSCTVSQRMKDGMNVITEVIALSNKGITLYITLKRALAVSTKLIVSQRKTVMSTVFELIIFALINCIPLFINLATANTHYAIVCLVYSILLVVVMSVLTIYIGCKLKSHRKLIISNSRHTRSTTQDDFQKLAFLVATTFTCFHFLAIAFFSYLVSHGDHDVSDDDGIGRWLEFGFIVGLAVNAAVNLFIYVAISASFRQVLVRYFRRTSDVTLRADFRSTASGSQQILTSM